MRLLHVLQPFFLFATGLTYFLGAGISRYLGAELHWDWFLAGLAWMASVQLGAQAVFGYFNTMNTKQAQDQVNKQTSKPSPSELRLSGQSVLLIALACFTAAASLTVLLISQLQSVPVVYLIMVLGLLAGLSYTLPPFALATRGYGELILAFSFGFLTLALGFTIQTGSMHRLILMIAFPMVVLLIAMFIALGLRNYARDSRLSIQNLVTRMGWSSAIYFHNVFILSAYLLVGLAALLGLPGFALWAALLSLPVGLLEIWQMWRIGQGGKPNWKALTINAAATFSAMAYLLAYSFWTH
jgi:1,4-dihydroxy-2-naphthoate octaprenyltransferase